MLVRLGFANANALSFLHSCMRHSLPMDVLGIAYFFKQGTITLVILLVGKGLYTVKSSQSDNLFIQVETLKTFFIIFQHIDSIASVRNLKIFEKCGTTTG